jgi:hypothetical protein
MIVRTYQGKNDQRHVKNSIVQQILMITDVLLYQMFFVNETDVLL